MTAQPTKPRVQPVGPGQGDLGEIVRERVDKLVQTTAETGQPPSVEDLRAISRLARVNELASARSRRSKLRHPLVLLCGGTALLVLLAATVEVPKVRVELDFEASALLFEIAEPNALDSPLHFRSLYATGISGVELSPALAEAQRQSVENAASSGALLVAPATKGHGTINLVTLPLDPGTRVSLATGPSFDNLRIGLERGAGAPALTADLTFDGDLALGADRPLSLRSPEPVGVRAEGGRLDLDVTLSGLPVDLGDHLRVSRLDLHRQESSGHGADVKQSTASSAKLSILSLRDARYELRRSDVLILKRLSGQIDELRATSTGVRGRFTGTVHDLRLETGGAERSLKPSVLEWLQAAKPLQLAWAAVLWAFAFVVNLYRWWSGER